MLKEELNLNIKYLNKLLDKKMKGYIDFEQHQNINRKNMHNLICEHLEKLNKNILNLCIILENIK